MGSGVLSAETTGNATHCLQHIAQPWTASARQPAKRQHQPWGAPLHTKLKNTRKQRQTASAVACSYS